MLGSEEDSKIENKPKTVSQMKDWQDKCKKLSELFRVTVLSQFISASAYFIDLAPPIDF